MTKFYFSRSLEELTFEETSSRGLIAVGPPISVEGDSLNLGVDASTFRIMDEDIPKEAIAYVPADEGHHDGNYAIIAIQFYRRP
jgi:hypothetical protein